MTRYHVRTDGSMGVCTAREGNCPFSGEEGTRHFTNKAEALRYSEERIKAYSAGKALGDSFRKFHKSKNQRSQSDERHDLDLLPRQDLPKTKERRFATAAALKEQLSNPTVDYAPVVMEDPYTGVPLKITSIERDGDVLILRPYVPTKEDVITESQLGGKIRSSRLRDIITPVPTVEDLKHELDSVDGNSKIYVDDWKTGTLSEISHLSYDASSGMTKINYGRLAYPFSDRINTYTVYGNNEAQGLDSPAFKDLAGRLEDAASGEYCYVLDFWDGQTREVGSSSFYDDADFDTATVGLEGSIPSVSFDKTDAVKLEDLTFSDVEDYRALEDGGVVTSSDSGVRFYNAQVPERFVMIQQPIAGDSMSEEEWDEASDEDRDEFLPDRKAEVEAFFKAMIPDADETVDWRFWRVDDVRDKNGDKIEGVSVYCAGTNYPGLTTPDDWTYGPQSPWRPERL